MVNSWETLTKVLDDPEMTAWIQKRLALLAPILASVLSAAKHGPALWFLLRNVHEWWKGFLKDLLWGDVVMSPLWRAIGLSGTSEDPLLSVSASKVFELNVKRTIDGLTDDCLAVFAMTFVLNLAVCMFSLVKNKEWKFPIGMLLGTMFVQNVVYGLHSAAMRASMIATNPGTWAPETGPHKKLQAIGFFLVLLSQLWYCVFRRLPPSSTAHSDLRMVKLTDRVDLMEDRFHTRMSDLDQSVNDRVQHIQMEVNALRNAVPQQPQQPQPTGPTLNTRSKQKALRELKLENVPATPFRT